MEYIREEYDYYGAVRMTPTIKRGDLKVGDMVMTRGYHDDVNLDDRVGKILKIGEYGNLLIEFKDPFSKQLHQGHGDIGKKGCCFYVPLANIETNDPKKFVELKPFDPNDDQWWFQNSKIAKKAGTKPKEKK
jgi:hypothetical protein